MNLIIIFSLFNGFHIKSEKNIDVISFKLAIWKALKIQLDYDHVGDEDKILWACIRTKKVETIERKF